MGSNEVRLFVGSRVLLGLLLALTCLASPARAQPSPAPKRVIHHAFFTGVVHVRHSKPKAKPRPKSKLKAVRHRRIRRHGVRHPAPFSRGGS